MSFERDRQSSRKSERKAILQKERQATAPGEEVCRVCKLSSSAETKSDDSKGREVEKGRLSIVLRAKDADYSLFLFLLLFLSLLLLGLFSVFFPGLPMEFRQTVYVEIGHFEPMPISIRGVGTFPSLFLSLSRRDEALYQEQRRLMIEKLKHTETGRKGPQRKGSIHTHRTTYEEKEEPHEKFRDISVTLLWAYLCTCVFRDPSDCT